MTPDTVGCVEAEAAVLGAIMRCPAAQSRALAGHLESEDFTDPRNRLVFGAIVDVLADRAHPDPVTLLGQLRRAGQERCWTADRSAGVFLFDLLGAAPVAANAGHFGRPRPAPSPVGC